MRWCGTLGEFYLGSERSLLIREADAAFHADDKPRCIELIEHLYRLFDTMVDDCRGRLLEH